MIVDDLEEAQDPLEGGTSEDDIADFLQQDELVEGEIVDSGCGSMTSGGNTPVGPGPSRGEAKSTEVQEWSISIEELEERLRLG
ncbi:hypothetical protein PM082_012417 [Marasmius tenuissimus]|nr:hypothetical protein PM082_012417 [Marasmius tenuissimus]